MEISPTRWSQITEIFERALALPPQVRTAFLADACGTDESLRAEVESLLVAHQAAGEDFLGEGELSRQASALLSNQLPDLSGQSIKHFVLLKRLGIGGMGEVYLANDNSLRRQVALKLLPAQTALEDERLRRFAREARAASSLNHPNIMTVYEFGQENGRHFIVTEYVEGQTLRERIAQGTLTLEETLTIADQVLAALEVAHTAGIIHRDIKPENLMLRHDGVVKVLDFGIAKLLPRLREKEGAKRTAVTRFLSTEQGLVLGTPGYMSPEQVRGLEVTTCSDLFSFGVVLYELLVGQLPFQGDTNADVNAQVLKMEPLRMAQFRPDLPPAYEALMNRLLAKDPAQRWPNASELRLALAHLPRQPLNSRQVLRERLRQAKRPLAFGAVLFLCVFLLGGLVWNWRRSQRENSAPFTGRDIADLSFKNIYTNKLGREIESPVFSPDGQFIVFEMNEADVLHLYLLGRGGGVPQRLTNSKASELKPVWSPDGQSIAFISNRSGAGDWGVWRVARTGGKPEWWFKLPSQAAELIAWRKVDSEERLYFATEQNLHVFNVSRQNTEQLTKLPLLKPDRASFSLSPEGQRLVFLEWKEQASRLNLMDLRTGLVETLYTIADSLRTPRWMADGMHVVFIREVAGNLQPHIYSLSKRQAAPLQIGNDDFSDLAVSPDGRALLGRSKDENANIYEIDLLGQENALTTEKGVHHLPTASPDGQRLVFQSVTGHLKVGGNLMEKRLDDLNSEPVSRADLAMGAQWSPNGNWLAFAKSGINQRSLYLQNVTGKEDRLVSSQLPQFWLQTIPYSLISQGFTFTHDSRHLVYVALEDNQNQLWRFDTATGLAQALSPLSRPQTYYLSPVCAPSGERVAFISREARTSTESAATRRLLVAENNRLLEVYQNTAVMQMVGWLNSDNDLLVAEGHQGEIGKVQDATLLKCNVATKRCEPLGLLRDVYLSSLQLSPDKTQLAFVGQNRRSLNIGLFRLGSRQSNWLTSNSDTSSLYAGLSWAYDSKRIYFSKQTSFEILRLIESR